MKFFAELNQEVTAWIELTLTGQDAPGGQIDVGEVFKVRFTVRHAGGQDAPPLENVRLALTGTSFAEPTEPSGEIPVADSISAGESATAEVRFEALTALRDYMYRHLEAKSMPPFGFVIQVQEQLVQPTEEIAAVQVLASVDLSRYLQVFPIETSPVSFQVQIESPLPPESIGPI